jgi:ribonucleoside-triphosphate reductase
MNEACLNFLGKDVGTPEGLACSLEVMHFLRKLMIEFQEETGHFYNLESTPAVTFLCVQGAALIVPVSRNGK